MHADERRLRLSSLKLGVGNWSRRGSNPTRFEIGSWSFGALCRPNLSPSTFPPSHCPSSQLGHRFSQIAPIPNNRKHRRSKFSVLCKKFRFRGTRNLSSAKRPRAPVLRMPANMSHGQNPDHLRPFHVGDVVRKHLAVDAAITLRPQRRHTVVFAHPSQVSPYFGPETLTEPEGQIVVIATRLLDLPLRLLENLDSHEGRCSNRAITSSRSAASARPSLTA